MRRNRGDTTTLALGAVALAAVGYLVYRARKTRLATEATRLRGASGLGTGTYDPSQWGGR